MEGEKNNAKMFNPAEDEIIDLLELARAVVHRAWAVILAIIIGAGAGYGMSSVAVTPQYDANVLLYVNNSSISLGNASFSLSDMNASNNLVRTYEVILKSRTVLEDIISWAGVDYSVSELRAMISTKSYEDTPVLSITVTDPDAEEGVKIANMAADVLSDAIMRIVNGTSVEIVDYAVLPEKASTPGHLHYMELGAMAGAVICIAAIVLMELMNDSIRKEDDFMERYSYPLLATIPDLSQHSGGKYSYGSYYGKPPEASRENRNASRTDGRNL